MGLRRAGGTDGDGNRGGMPRHAVKISTALLVLAAMLLVAMAMGDLAGAKKAKPAAQSSHKNTSIWKYPNKITRKSKCGSNEHIGWGGFSLEKTNLTGSGAFTFPDGMGPTKNKTDHWTFTAHNRKIIDDQVSVFAYCNPGKKPKIVRYKKSISPSEETESVIASCGKGQTLVGGGWYSEAIPSAIDTSSDNHGELALVSLNRSGSKAWAVTVFNEKSVPVDVTSIAVCGSGKKPKEVGKTVNLKYGKSGGTSVACPKGTKVLFGGVQGQYDLYDYISTFPTRLYRDGAKAVSVYGMHPGVGDVTTSRLTAIAYCR